MLKEEKAMKEHRNISIADQIFEQLEKDILSGKYQRGEVLSELRLSKEMNVSRTPIREALLRLAQENILQETGRGMVVIGITNDDMLDMYDIRLHLEGEAARRAAVNITDEQLAQLQELTELQRFYINKQGNSSSEHTKNLDSQFHEVLYTASGSKSYTEVLVRLHKKMSKFRMASVSKQSRALQSNDEHMEICRAMALHDPDAAEEAVLQHVRNAMDRMEHLELMDG
jgi:DNA-binding GntR family transcriptional regulator